MNSILLVATIIWFAGWVTSSCCVIFAIQRKRRLYNTADEKMKAQFDKFRVTSSIIRIIVLPLVFFLAIILLSMNS
jgi:hypothetical protein